MYSHQVVKNLAPALYNEDDNELIGIMHKLEVLNLKDKYYHNCRVIYTDNRYDEAAKFVSLFRDKYVCVDIPKRIVYIFKNHRWVRDHGLKQLIGSVINFSPDLADKYTIRQHFLNDVILHLYLDKFIDATLNYKAILMNHKVFDISTGDMRKGYPVDYITLSTNVSPSSDYRQELEIILKDIFPSDDIYRYIMRFIGSLLIPGNRDKLFMVWSGTGDNGKSILMKLIELALGEYSLKLPTSTITGKRTASGAATPDIALIERKLVAFLQEPSNTERINVGIVKELTGNDSIYVRGLYESGRNISVLAKLVYVVNSTENLAMIEKAIWNRIVIVPFNTTFVDSPKYPNERKRDLDLLNRLHIYAPSFLGLMVDEARMYLQEGLYNSSTIKSNTLKIKNENDHIANYISSVGLSAKYPDFVQYMKTFMPKEPIPSLKMFEHELSTKEQ